MKAIKSLATSSGRQDAFSVKDLVAVLAVVVVLGAIQLPSIANSKGKSDVASCLSNHRHLVRGWRQYADDNNDRLTGNLDGGDAQNGANSNKTWCVGWLDANFSHDNTNWLYLMRSQLGNYSQTPKIYKCPADTSLSSGTIGIPRVRSISMNAYIGERVGPFTTGYRQFKKMSEILDPKPSQAFVFIDEREDSIN